MLRNKEVRHMLMGLIVWSLATAGILGIHNWNMAGYLMITHLVMIVMFLWYTRRRYHHIAQLSSYLQEIYQGKETFDIRDHAEGELSILKSDIYKITQILKWQKERLLKDQRYLAEALSDISHQLKTPLTSMLMMSELLRDEQLPNERRIAFSYQLETQLERMEWLVSSLLKLSRIEAEAIHFQPEVVFVQELIIESIQPIMTAIEKNALHLELDCDPDLVVHMDRKWTQEAILNIVKNAMEHSPYGSSIHLQVQQNPLHTSICITDYGSGIAKKDLPHIFERFYKGSHSHSDSVGIGLAMSKAILNRQHATIDVESHEGEGTSFIIRIFDDKSVMQES